MKVRLPGDKDEPRARSPRAETAWREAPVPHNPLAVECSHCRKEIPRSAAINPEAGDYALYFCGLSCYRQWLTNHEWIPSRHR